MSLMYSPKAGDKPITFNQLTTLPTPPSRGRWHQTVPFYDFADEVSKQLASNGFEILGQEYAITHDNNRMFGLMEVSHEDVETPDWGVQIGLRASHDQSVSRGMVLGSRVFVCSNLCFSGDLMSVQTKQTTHIMERLPEMIARGLANLQPMIERNQKRFDHYKLAPIDDVTADHTLVEMLRAGCLSPSQMARAVREFDEPSFEEHGEEGDSVWKLFNACTQALKPTGTTVNHDLIRSRSEGVLRHLDELVEV